MFQDAISTDLRNQAAIVAPMFVSANDVVGQVESGLAGTQLDGYCFGNVANEAADAVSVVHFVLRSRRIFRASNAALVESGVSLDVGSKPRRNNTVQGLLRALRNNIDPQERRETAGKEQAVTIRSANDSGAIESG